MEQQIQGDGKWTDQEKELPDELQITLESDIWEVVLLFSKSVSIQVKQIVQDCRIETSKRHWLYKPDQENESSAFPYQHQSL